MELWFVMAIGATVTAGLAGFTTKVAAWHEHDSELFVLYSAFISLIWTVPLAWYYLEVDIHWFAIAVAFVAGLTASVTGIMRIYALRYIDTTIYFPLFKLVSPILAVIIGISFFAESFSGQEWLGILLSLLVPLFLITKTEQGRQKNLTKGLLLVLVTGFVSAITVGMNKYAIDLFPEVFTLMLALVLGTILGSLVLSVKKRGYRNMKTAIRDHTNRDLLWLSLWRSVLISTSFGMTLFAFALGGPLGIVYTIHSLYILIPIILAIVLYDEHWNLQKVLAITLSVAALALLH